MTVIAIETRQLWRKGFRDELAVGEHQKHGSMKAFFKDFADRHDEITPAGVSTYYYWGLNNNDLPYHEKTLGKKGATSPATGEGEAPELIDTELKGSNPPEGGSQVDKFMAVAEKAKRHFVGQVVKCRITKIMEYGAFVETVDEPRSNGLIHVSNISYSHTDHPSRYFTPGDIVMAEITKVDLLKGLNLSTKTFTLQDRKMIVLPPEPAPMPDHIPFVQTIGERLVAAQQISVNTRSEEELKEVTDYINPIVGALTPKARDMIHSLIETHGMFRFTRALTKAESSFQPDLGVALAMQVESSISSSL